MKKPIKGRPLLEIVTEQDALQTESEQWYKDNVKEGLLACKSTDDVNDILAELSQSANCMELPCNIRIPLAIVMGDLIDAEDKRKEEAKDSDSA